MNDAEKTVNKIIKDNVNCQPTWEQSGIVFGQGTLRFNIKRGTPFYIQITSKNNKKMSKSFVLLSVNKECVMFHLWNGSEPTRLTSETGPNVGYNKTSITTYWLSFDSDSMTVKYGKGYCMEETTIMKYTFTDECDIKSDLFNKLERKTFSFYEFKPFISVSEMSRADLLKLLTIYKLGHSIETSTLKSLARTSVEDMEKQVDISPYPFLQNRPFVLRDSSLANMFDIDSGKYTYSGSLPDVCKQLYDNVKAVNMTLDWTPAYCPYKLSDAIGYSLKEGILAEIVKQKQEEFGNEDEAYIRVTLGKEFGNSPGTPYVLELWPSSKRSPVHNHGKSYAVIRVIFGRMTVEIYNKTTEDENGVVTDFLKKFEIKKGDYTWISPEWYQTHMLTNTSGDFCATIQCYLYGANDDMFYPFFDYVKTTEDAPPSIDQFVPESDYTFTKMYDDVMQEYKTHMEGST